MTAHIYEEGSQQKGMVINMGKPRIIIADTDLNYITLLELKFVEELFDKVNLEMITDKEYFDSLFLAKGITSSINERFPDSAIYL